MDDLTKNRKIFVDASAAIASLTVKKLGHDAEGRKLAKAIEAATRDRDTALSALHAIEGAEEAPSAPPEARVVHFQNGRPIDADTPQDSDAAPA